jgi:hypothetical protein
MQKIPTDINQAFNYERATLEQELNVRIITDAVPSYDPRLWNIYSDVAIPQHDIEGRLSLFAHKYGFVILKSPAGLEKKLFLLLRCGIGSPYIPNVSEAELLRSFENLLLIRRAAFGSHRRINLAETISTWAKSSPTPIKNTPVRISDLPEKDRKIVFDMAKIVFLGDLFKLENPYIQGRDKVEFRKNGNRIEICFLMTTKEIRRTYPQSKETAIPSVLIENLPLLLEGISNIEPSEMIENKKFFTPTMKGESPARTVKIFNILFRESAKLTGEGIWKIPNRKPIFSYKNDYSSLVREVIPMQILSLGNANYFKMSCSRDMRLLNSSKNKQSLLRMFINEREYGYGKKIYDKCSDALYVELDKMLKIKNKISYRDLDSLSRTYFLLIQYISMLGTFISSDLMNAAGILNRLDDLYFRSLDKTIDGTPMSSVEFLVKNGDKYYTAFSASARR